MSTTTRKLSRRELARIKSAVLRATEIEARENAMLRKQVYEMQRLLERARKSRDKWRRAACRIGGWHRDKVMQ